MTFANWPWGSGEHQKNYGIDKERVRCFECGEGCYSPHTDGDLEFVCMCCREPLYELRIAELERFANAVCAEYEEYPDDPTQPFAGYELVLEWVKDSRRDERDYAELTGCPMCEEGYPPHTCASYLDLVKMVRADKNRIAELERELAISRHPSNQ